MPLNFCIRENFSSNTVHVHVLILIVKRFVASSTNSIASKLSGTLCEHEFTMQYLCTSIRHEGKLKGTIKTDYINGALLHQIYINCSAVFI